MSRLRNYLKPFLSWKFLLCFALAWMITNGWAYVFIIVGTTCDITWMWTVGTSYQAFLWMPFTVEKLVTIPIAMWFNFKLFKDEKTAEALTNMLNQAKDDWKAIKSKFKRKKK